MRVVAATKYCFSNKDFHKTSQIHKRRFVAAMCRRDMLLQLVAGPAHGVICRRDLLLQLVA